MPTQWTTIFTQDNDTILDGKQAFLISLSLSLYLVPWEMLLRNDFDVIIYSLYIHSTSGLSISSVLIKYKKELKIIKVYKNKILFAIR